MSRRMKGRGPDRVNPKRWAQVRRQVLERDGYRCRCCGRAGRLEVDHIRPLHKGGDPWSLDNLQTLARGCHIAKTRRENQRTPTPAERAWASLVNELLPA